MTQKSTSRRVLILTTAYLPQVGGSELAIKNITDRLPGVCFDLITSRFSKKLPEYEKIGNVNVYRVGNSLSLSSFLLSKNFFPISVFFKACQLMRKYGPYNIVHAYQASQAAGGGWLLKLKYPDILFLVTVQEGKVLNEQPLLLRFFRYLVFRKADAITVISNYLASYVGSQNSKVPINVIPNGIDPEQFPISLSRWQAGHAYRQAGNFQFPIKNKKENTIITVSRLVEKNGIEYLIEAMTMVSNEIPNANLVIIGDGPLKESLRFKVKSLNLENCVEFLGEIPNELLPKYLSKADIFVRPSLSEGLGTAFLEAMAVGVPIIGTQVGGIPDFLKDGETGLFCNPKDSESVANKIVMLIENDELRNKLVENGRKLVKEKYSWDKIAIEFEKLYAMFGNLTPKHGLKLNETKHYNTDI